MFPTESNRVGLILGFEHDALATLELVGPNMAAPYYQTIIIEKNFGANLWQNFTVLSWFDEKFLISLSNHVIFYVWSAPTLAAIRTTYFRS